MDKRKLKDGTFTNGHGKSDASGDGMVLVGFELPATVSATTVSVCGDFNGWRAEGQPLARLDDGRFRTDIVLPAGARYRFRYLLDGERWENDPAADDYLPNGLGTEDSVVDLTDTRSLPVIDATTLAGTSDAPEPPGTPPVSEAAPTGAAAGADESPVPPRPGLQRLRIRRETWERIQAEAAARGIEPEEFIARLLDAAMTPGERGATRP